MKNRPIIITESIMPNLATHCHQSVCGYSVYRGVLVQWDEDRDMRVLGVLDDMPAKIVDQLAVVQEHEGSIAFMWKGDVPPDYRDGKGIYAPDGDYWSIYQSATVPKV